MSAQSTLPADRLTLHLPEAVMRRAVQVLGGLPIVPGARRDGLPDDCPVIALGTSAFAGFFLSADGAVVAFPNHIIDAPDIRRLFGGSLDWAGRTWQRWSKYGVRSSVHTAAAAHALIGAAFRAGNWPDAPPLPPPARRRSMHEC